MTFISKITALAYRSGSFKSFGKKFLQTNRNVVSQLSAISSLTKVEFSGLEAPSRYVDVAISNQSYCDYVFENRGKHFGKVAMVS